MAHPGALVADQFFLLIAFSRRQVCRKRRLALCVGRLFAAALILVLVATRPVAADPARFWLSLSDSPEGAPIGPEAPVITGAEGRKRELHIWAQPATEGPGPHDATTNPYRTLQNFSLNLISPETDPIVDFVNGTFTVHNPLRDGMPRFQFTFDSHSQPTKVESALEGVYGLQGFSVSNVGFTGIGPESLNAEDQHCQEGELFCATMSDGSPAWLVASLALQAAQASGSAEFFLQIGTNGMNHRGESSAATEVVFGVNSIGMAPIYNPGLVDNNNDPLHRDMTLLDDDRDVQILAAPFSPGDYDGDGSVGPQDHTLWKSTFGDSVLPGEGADGNGDGIIDAADYVFWRKRFLSAAANVSAAVPEPAASLLVFSAFCLLYVKRRSERSPSIMHIA
jgi:hypothetical protein